MLDLAQVYREFVLWHKIDIFDLFHRRLVVLDNLRFYLLLISVEGAHLADIIEVFIVNKLSELILNPGINDALFLYV